MTANKRPNLFKRIFFPRKKTPPQPPAETGPESGKAALADWKQKALADFTDWLQALPDSPPAAETATADSCDLYTLLSEFSALHQEIKLQNREQHRSIQTFADMSEAYQKSMQLFEKSVSGIDQLEARIRENAEQKALQPFLEVRDALIRGRGAARAAIEKKRWYRPGPHGLEAIAEGYDMAIRRFDRALSYANITPVPATGQPFDPKTMKAVGRRAEPDKAEGLVLEEQTGGFLKNDALLRTAEVIVNAVQ